MTRHLARLGGFSVGYFAVVLLGRIICRLELVETPPRGPSPAVAIPCPCPLPLPCSTSCPRLAGRGCNCSCCVAA